MCHKKQQDNLYNNWIVHKNSIPFFQNRDKDFSQSSFYNALMRDGLIKADTINGILEKKDWYYLIALVLDTKKWVDLDTIFDKSNWFALLWWDYHFYRQDDDGTWSHKFNNCNVSRVDASNQSITNPEYANRDYTKHLINWLVWTGWNYPIFVGYFYVPNRGIHRT